VRFFATLNAVNFNGTTTGDQPNTATPLTVNEASSAGIGSARPPALALYPNPAADKLHLKLIDGGKPVAVTIRDLNGRPVLSEAAIIIQDEAVVNVSALSPGIYLVVASQGERQYAASFVRK
jgi:hypothetical protein